MRNRFWRKNKALLLALGGVLAVCLVYSVGPPLLKLFAGEAADSLGRAGLLSAIWSRTLESVVALWLFMLGGAIGSFLNVVVWRMPLGMSIAAGGSRCPFCRTAILSSDNIPIFGWLKLRGRCRACRLPISPRYPLVELTLAVAFLLVGVSELHFACYTMRALDPPGTPGFDQLLIFSRWDICGVYLYHATLLTLLTGAVLFSLDGNRTPVGYTLFALLVAATAVIWPTLHPVAAVEIPLEDVAPRVISGLSVLAGAGVGLLGGLMLMVVMRFVARVGHTANALLMLVWIGAFLGWKMVLLIGPAVMLGCCLQPFIYGRQWPVRILLPAVTGWAGFLLLLHLDEWLGDPVAYVSPWIFAVVCGVFWPVSAVLLAMVTRYCHYPTVEYP